MEKQNVELEKAWTNGLKAVYLNIDIDSVDSGISMGIGWPGSGGFLSHEILINYQKRRLILRTNQKLKRLAQMEPIVFYS